MIVEENIIKKAARMVRRSINSGSCGFREWQRFFEWCEWDRISIEKLRKAVYGPSSNDLRHVGGNRRRSKMIKVGHNTYLKADQIAKVSLQKGSSGIHAQEPQTYWLEIVPINSSPHKLYLGDITDEAQAEAKLEELLQEIELQTKGFSPSLEMLEEAAQTGDNQC